MLLVDKRSYQDLDDSQNEALHDWSSYEPSGTHSRAAWNGQEIFSAPHSPFLAEQKDFWQGIAGDTEEIMENLHRTNGYNWHLKNEFFW